MVAMSRRLRKSRPAQLSSNRLMSASGSTGTGCSGTSGLRIFTIGEGLAPALLVEPAEELL
jgi:hypothetical protein